MDSVLQDFVVVVVVVFWHFIFFTEDSTLNVLATVAPKLGEKDSCVPSRRR